MTEIGGQEAGDPAGHETEGMEQPTDNATRKQRTAVERWWDQYCGPKAADRGVRARLRRCRSTREAISVQAAATLGVRLGAIRDELTAEGERALDLARVLAHVTEDDARRPMQAAGWKVFPGERAESEFSSEERPRLSSVRFQRLLTVEEGEELVRAFIRLVRLLDGKVGVRQLAYDFRYWGHPEYGERIRRRWAFDYYAAASAAPDERRGSSVSSSSTSKE